MNTFESLPEVDQLAVQRDADLLDALAGREADGPGAGLQGLLWVLGADVDEGLAALLAEPLEDSRSEPGAVIDLAAAGRRRATRTLTATLLVAGLVSVSGVAAALTGDPLSPYRSVISALTGGDRSVGQSEDDVRQEVRVVRSKLRDGDLAGAQAAVEVLRTGVAALPNGTRRGATQQLAALEAKLARAFVKDAKEAAKAAEKAAKDAKAKDPPRPDGLQDGRPEDKAVPPVQTGSDTEPNGKARGQQPEQAEKPAKESAPKSPAAQPAAAKPSDVQSAPAQPAEASKADKADKG